MSDGEAKCDDQDFEGAVKAFEEAQMLFNASGDEISSLEALTKRLSAMIAKGDTEDALRLAQDQRTQFQARWSLVGEICTTEQILNAYIAMANANEVEKTARSFLQRLKLHEEYGMDTTSGQALMWFNIAKACLVKRDHDEVMNAAEMATKLFADAQEYEYESMAVKLYNEANSQKGRTNYLNQEQLAFYLRVRIGGIAYGPRYRDNHEIMIKPSGSMHVACCLQLTCEEGEDWEHDVGFHPGLIDAGGHAAFANNDRPDVQAAAAEAMKDPNFVPSGPNIPFLMDHAELRHRRDNSDMYVNMAGQHQYMFTNAGTKPILSGGHSSGK
jgi:hypothetical protein